MRFKLLLILLLVMTTISGVAQKVNISLKLIDSTCKDPSDYVFEVSTLNVNFNHYWIQDTSYLKEQAEVSEADLLYPFLWKKAKGKYELYEDLKHRPGTLRSKCMDSCCNCILLKKGETISFTLKFLKPYNLMSGDYRMRVAVHPPLFSPNQEGQLAEIESNFIYFSIN